MASGRPDRLGRSMSLIRQRRSISGEPTSICRSANHRRTKQEDRLLQSLADMRAIQFATPILLLFISNIFMTFAWYGHLKFKDQPLYLVILVSWGIAFVEYCFAVPANRFGSSVYSTAQLKTMQEAITLIVFAVFSVTYL